MNKQHLTVERFEADDGAHYSVCVLNAEGSIEELATCVMHATREEAMDEMREIAKAQP